MRLGRGVGELAAPVRDRHADYFLQTQQADGGFPGRDGVADLYYTAFGVRALALLNRLDGDPAERAAQFLRSQLTTSAHIVDFFSLVFAAQLLDSATGLQVFDAAHGDWQSQVAQTIESLRTEDGGYAKSHEGAAGSTYYSFLAALTLGLIERPLVEPQRLAEFVLSQFREDGGFVEIRKMRRSGSNPTAAAIGLLRILDQEQQQTTLLDQVRDDASDFLLDLQTEEGGLRANTRIPIADLLSTFTGLLTLADLGASDEAELDAVRRFVASLEQPNGGFLAAAWDEAVDVEYSFYGLATLGLLETL